jgi:hypothetical protein
MLNLPSDGCHLLRLQNIDQKALSCHGLYRNPLKNHQKLTQKKYSLQSKNLFEVCEIVPTTFFWVKIDECFL